MNNPTSPARAAWRVTLGGQDLTVALAPRLISLTLTEKRGNEADQLDIELHDADGTLDIPADGVILQVSLGWAVPPAGQRADLVDKGRFKVDEVSWSGPPDRLVIKARSADFTDAFRVRREKKRKGTTLGAVLQEIAADNSLTAAVDPSLAAKPVPVLAQDQRSDAAMLRFLGRRHDAVATVKDGKLLFAPIGKGATPGGIALPAFTITRASGDSYSWSRAAREDYGGVEARWHDSTKGKRNTVKAGGGKGTPKRLKRTFHRESDAKDAAAAEDKRVKRAAASFDLTLAYGNPSIYPEQRGTLSGFKPSIDASKWIAAEVAHTMDATGGFRTKLKFEVGS